ncbi:MAG: DUF4157 domain-containing protein, partial [Bacteroidota bacterium]
MQTPVNKAEENESQRIPRTTSTMVSRHQSAFQFVDTRAEAIVQRQLQTLADNSSEHRQLARFKRMADEYGTKQGLPIQKKENHTGLPDKLKSGIEDLSGYSMDDVNVHYRSDKPAQLNAHAYAQGTDIHIASGQEKYLPHEAWHVVQQKQGRVKPTMQIKGGVQVNDDVGLEKEADIMGAKAFQSNRTHESVPSSQGNNKNEIIQSKQLYTVSPQEVIQLKPPKDEHIFMYTDGDGRVWSRDLETNEWYRPGADGEKIFWTKADDRREDAFSEAGSVVNYFKNPKSIWGKKHGDLEAELLEEGFEESEYGGTSDAHEYIKRLSDNSIISVVINYG